jgi:thioesterase domain-containing protein
MALERKASLFRLVDKNAHIIVPFNDAREGIPLFCVHPMGGSVTSYEALARHLGGRLPIYGIQVPKQHLNAAFAASVEGIAECHVEAVRSLRPKGALVLAGWSSGAPIALEMAQRLRALGREVKLLVVYDGDLHNIVDRKEAWARSNYWGWVRNLPRWIEHDLRTGGGMRTAGRRWIKAKLKLAAASHGLRRFIPGNIHPLDAFVDTSNVPEGQRPFFRALYDAVVRYSPKFYDGDVLLYVAKTRPLWELCPVGEAWARISRALEMVEVEGSHFSLLQEPQVIALADDLRERLLRLNYNESAIRHTGPAGARGTTVEETQCRQELR